MGADLLINGIRLKKGVEPNWDAGLAKIESMTQLECFDAINPETPNELIDEGEDYKDGVRKAFLRIKHAYTIGSRYMTCLDFGDCLVTVVGGLSWGDHPELFEEMAIFTATAAKTVGFDIQ